MTAAVLHSPPLVTSTWRKEAMSEAPMKLSTGGDVPNTGGVFARRLAEALNRRLSAGFTAKHLARALNVSQPTVWSWLNGVNEPKGRHVVALIGFFDASFANEILAGTGCRVAKLGDVRRQVSALRIALQAIEDDAELDAIEREEIQHATEGRAVRRGDDPARHQVGSLLAEGQGPRDGLGAQSALAAHSATERGR